MVDTPLLYEIGDYMRVFNRGMGAIHEKDELLIERRDQGDYTVRRPGSRRASDVLPRQAEAINRAREFESNSTPMVERVRHTSRGRVAQALDDHAAPKPANRWFVIWVNGRSDKLRFGITKKWYGE